MTLIPEPPPLFGARLWLALGGIVLLAVLALTVPSCIQRHRSQAAQGRVDAGQAAAASNSAADAIGAVTRSGARETASETLTRDNERDIRAAPGAGQRIDMGAQAAGMKALCKRAAYQGDKKCASSH